jgi:hypothetical protein
MGGPDHQYDVHDFTAVDDYVAHLASKNRALIRETSARNFASYAKWGALVIVGIGIAIALILWGLSLHKDYKIVEKQIVVKEPVSFRPTIIVNAEDKNSRTQVVRQIAEGKTNRLSNEADDKSLDSEDKAVFNFTIFKQIPFKYGEIENVVVGMKYENSSSEKPEYQWCYVNKLNKDGTETKISLAFFSEAARNDSIVTANMATKMDLTIFELEQAQKLCSFE